MFDQVIVLLDGTDRDEAALAHGAGEAVRLGAGLLLLQVIPYPELALDPHHEHGGPAHRAPVLDPELNAARATALARLRAHAGRLSPLSRAEAACDIGDPRRRLVQTCARYRRPLVVIGSSDGDGLVQHPMGPAVRQLIADGTVDVLLVHDGMPAAELPFIPVELPGTFAAHH